MSSPVPPTYGVPPRALADPVADEDLTRRSWVLANLGLPLIPTTPVTAAFYTAASGQLVLVAPAAPQIVTLPAATAGAYVAVRRTNTPGSNTSVRADGTDSIVGVSLAPVWIRAQDEGALFRCYTAGQWVLEWHGVPSGGAVLLDDFRLSNARAPTLHAASHAAGGSDQVTPAAIGAVPVTPAVRTGSAGASISIDGTLAGDFDLTCTGDTQITPTGTPNGRTLVLHCLASGGARTPAVVAAVELTTGITARSLTVPSGGVGAFVLRYCALGASPAWYLASAYLVA